MISEFTNWLSSWFYSNPSDEPQSSSSSSSDQVGREIDLIKDDSPVINSLFEKNIYNETWSDFSSNGFTEVDWNTLLSGVFTVIEWGVIIPLFIAITIPLGALVMINAPFYFPFFILFAVTIAKYVIYDHICIPLKNRAYTYSELSKQEAEIQKIYRYIKDQDQDSTLVDESLRNSIDNSELFDIDGSDDDKLKIKSRAIYHEITSKSYSDKYDKLTNSGDENKEINLQLTGLSNRSNEMIANYYFLSKDPEFKPDQDLLKKVENFSNEEVDDFEKFLNDSKKIEYTRRKIKDLAADYRSQCVMDLENAYQIQANKALLHKVYAIYCNTVLDDENFPDIDAQRNSFNFTINDYKTHKTLGNSTYFTFKPSHNEDFQSLNFSDVKNRDFIQKLNEEPNDFSEDDEIDINLISDNS
ncbi:MAG: hypothetical protein WDZ28_01900 [Simkaniaceae bacterium]